MLVPKASLSLKQDREQELALTWQRLHKGNSFYLFAAGLWLSNAARG